MIFVDRVGFPVLAFVLMFVLCVVYLDKNTTAIKDNTSVLGKIEAALTKLDSNLSDASDKATRDHAEILKEVVRGRNQR